jgi:hypothetical protein
LQHKIGHQIGQTGFCGGYVDVNAVSEVLSLFPGQRPSLTALSLRYEMIPLSHMSWASPIRALVCATTPAATPFFSSRSSALIPASSLPTPASLKNTALSGTSDSWRLRRAAPAETDGQWHNLAQTHSSTSKMPFRSIACASAVPNCAIARQSGCATKGLEPWHTLARRRANVANDRQCRIRGL